MKDLSVLGAARRFNVLLTVLRKTLRPCGLGRAQIIASKPTSNGRPSPSLQDRGLACKSGRQEYRPEVGNACARQAPDMQSSTPQRQCVKTALLCTACIALAFLSASCGGGATEAIPTATGTPEVSLSPVSVSFASELVGNSSSAQSVTLTNSAAGS
jgi:hypothetical protein